MITFQGIQALCERIGITIVTVRYLKFSQIIWRIWYLARKPKIPSKQPIERRAFQGTPYFLKKNECFQAPHTFTFLNKQAIVIKSSDWNNKDFSDLWLYNLHYFDFLNQTHPAPLDLAEKWIDENPPLTSRGWEPYPTSLRIVNWIKWMISNNEYPTLLMQSLTEQVDHLSTHIEYHILGNHLFVNSKALIFAGLFFNSNQAEQWLKKGLTILKAQLKEQILDDGGHFELSPMYHAIILEDILDLLSLLRVYRHASKLTDDHIPTLEQSIPPMLSWLSTMSHPDGEIAFFNDCAIGIAQPPAALQEYAEHLGIQFHTGKIDTTHLKHSGYIRACKSAATLIVDVAEIGPSYQPGHAHADTLSFELSLGSERIFVNSGTSEYGISSRRHLQRSTRSHNTVTVNDENSSQVWSGFRVAKRAKPSRTVLLEKNETRISCSHNGYSYYAKGCIHLREWSLHDRKLLVSDAIERAFGNCTAYFHLHPHLEVSMASTNEFHITSKTHKIIFTSNVPGKLVDGHYYPEFGKSIPNQTIVLITNLSKIETEITWLTNHRDSHNK